MSLVSEERRKVKWSEISPSLQAKFTDLENKIGSKAKGGMEEIDSARITIGKHAPLNPQNDKELWVDTRYRVLRGYSEDYWEPTRAAWSDRYKVDYNDIKSADDPEPGWTPPASPTLVNKSATIFKFKQSGVTCSWDFKDLYGNNLGRRDACVIVWQNPVLTLTISPSISNGGYFFWSYYSNMSASDPTGSGVFEINGTTVNQTFNLAQQSRIMFDVDSRSHPLDLKGLRAGNDPTNPNGSLYFPGYPYPYDTASWDGILPSSLTRPVTPTYSSGNFTIEVKIDGQWYS